MDLNPAQLDNLLDGYRQLTKPVEGSSSVTYQTTRGKRTSGE